MTALVNPHESDYDPRLLERRGDVRISDGRIGTVIGFYKRSDQSVVVVKFASGESAAFPTREVEIL